MMTASAPIGRYEFVISVADQFARSSSGTTVEQPVVGFILDEGMVNEGRWLEGIERREIDLNLVRGALLDGFEAAAEHARERRVFSVDEAAARQTLPRVIEGRWDCPYGLLWC